MGRARSNPARYVRTARDDLLAALYMVQMGLMQIRNMRRNRASPRERVEQLERIWDGQKWATRLANEGVARAIPARVGMTGEAWLHDVLKLLQTISLAADPLTFELEDDNPEPAGLDLLEGRLQDRVQDLQMLNVWPAATLPSLRPPMADAPPGTDTLNLDEAAESLETRTPLASRAVADPVPEIAVSEFARQSGYSPGHVSRLRRRGLQLTSENARSLKRDGRRNPQESAAAVKRLMNKAEEESRRH